MQSLTEVLVRPVTIAFVPTATLPLIKGMGCLTLLKTKAGLT